MTLEEKASLCAGQGFWHTRAIERLDIPAILMTDGPHGLRKEIGSSRAGLAESAPATCFPTASCLASSWNRSLLAEVGSAIAQEALAEGVSLVLGPGANIKRSPLCGRNFEYFSEDPCLSGEMAAAWITGLQRQGVGASLKHFAVNNQETRRMSIDALVDERALREIYLAGFERAVKNARPWTVMAAYNRLNGTYCCEHERLLADILRGEWGFEGLVVSDWGATNNRAAGLQAGLDLEMPGTDNQQLIMAAVQKGLLSEDALDACVTRILDLVRKAQSQGVKRTDWDVDQHHLLARRAAAEGCVLLKNADGLLPLKKDMHIALLGAFAKQPRYQGAGSSLINPYRLDNLYDELRKLADGRGSLSFAEGYALEGQEPDQALLAQAAALAGSAHAAVVFVGLQDTDEVEGLDRRHLRLSRAHEALVQAAARANPRTIVVLSNGAPLEMPWVGQVGAILEGYLGGQAGAGALADILYGVVAPSGKLAESFPLRLEDHPAYHYFPGGPRTVEYRESIFVGYRYFDTLKKEVLFPFGHGLSYTQFSYSRLQLDHLRIKPGDPVLLSVSVRNSGRVPGSEVVQVYIAPPPSAYPRPAKELKAFEKLYLEPGEEKSLKFELDERAFAYYDVRAKDWKVEAGVYTILVGSSSRDIRLTAELMLLPQAGRVTALFSETEMPIYLLNENQFSREQFEALLGRPLPENVPQKRGSFDLNTPLSDMQTTLVGRLLQRVINKQISKLTRGFENTPQAMMMQEMVAEGPLRLLLMSGGGSLSRPMLEALILLANGQLGAGIRALIQSKKDK